MSDLVLKGRYEGLAPELAQILIKGKDVIEGTYEDTTGLQEEHVKCVLTSYFALAASPYRVYRENSDSFADVKNFTPSRPEEMDWSKVPIDTLIEIETSSGDKYRRYFSHFADGAVFTFWDGATSKSRNVNLKIAEWTVVAFNFKIIEYPCTCQKEKT